MQQKILVVWCFGFDEVVFKFTIAAACVFLVCASCFLLLLYNIRYAITIGYLVCELMMVVAKRKALQ